MTATYDSPYVLPALQTAANLGLRTIVATNSWKDVYTTTKVGVIPSALIVSSDEAAADVCEMNPHLLRSTIHRLPSLHLEPFFKPPATMSNEELCDQLGIDPARPLVCYTAAAPAAVLDEERIVDRLLTLIKEGAIPGRPQVILRMNPMEDGSRWVGIKRSHPELILNKPLWEWNPPIDWCCALPDDIPLWTGLVYTAQVNVSIPSTVTLEFAAYEKPVVNVCFDLPDPRSTATSNRRFWEAPFYKDVRERGLAIPAFGERELTAALSLILERDYRQGRRLAHAQATSPVEGVLRVVRDVLA